LLVIRNELTHHLRPLFPATAALLAALLLAGCFGSAEKATLSETETRRGSGPLSETTPGAEGLAIAYTLYGEGDSMLVLIHGWGGSQRIWDSQVDDLAQRFTVVTVDLGGHGLAGRGRAQASLKQLSVDLAAVLDAVGAKRAILIGHSMGGEVALLTALARPQAVAAVIGVEAFREPPLDPAIWQALLGDLEQDFPTACRSFLRGLFAQTTEEMLVDKAATEACRLEPALGLALMREMAGFDLGKTLSALPQDLPVRAINTTEDLEPPPAPASEPLQRFHADSKTSFIARSGHFPMLEQSAELTRQLAGAINEFEAGKK
jgi:pimeloyl-ACP methyl ester carboxylesterase